MLTKRDNISLGCAGLAAGTTAGTFKTTNIFAFLVLGLAYFKAITDNIAFAVRVQVPALTLPSLAASQQTVYFLSVRASDGAIFAEPMRPVAMGGGAPSNVVASNTGSGFQTGGSAEWPSETPGYAIFGAIKVATTAAGAFIPGTTSLGAANQVVTYYNAGPDYGVSIAL